MTSPQAASRLRQYSHHFIAKGRPIRSNGLDVILCDDQRRRQHHQQEQRSEDQRSGPTRKSQGMNVSNNVPLSTGTATIRPTLHILVPACLTHPCLTGNKLRAVIGFLSAEFQAIMVSLQEFGGYEFRRFLILPEKLPPHFRCFFPPVSSRRCA